MSAPKDVTAVLVTRGDLSFDLLQPIYDSIYAAGIPAIYVWNNRAVEDVKVYGRYAALDEVHTGVVYVQDDDCVIEPSAIRTLLGRYEPDVINANMPISRWADYPDSALVGWGAVFDRDLPGKAFARWRRFHGYTIEDPVFQRDCDMVFTGLTPCRKVDLGFRHLPWAETDGRLFKEPNHQHARNALMTLVREVRDA